MPETVTLRFRVGGATIEATAEVPPEPISVANLVPFLQAVEESIVETASADVTTGGRAISCRAGCGACCRQIVPISVAEAYHLADVVASLPADERRAVERRFAEALEALEQADLGEELRVANTRQDPDGTHRFGVRYFVAGVACPFLVDESCSIHPHRPLACREYLVTSPAANCATPEASSIERVPVPRDLSRALYRLGDGVDTSVRWVPLVRLLEWVRGRGPLPTAPAKELLARLVRRAADGS
jgi:Fe-S-cluster containining protein